MLEKYDETNFVAVLATTVVRTTMEKWRIRLNLGRLARLACVLRGGISRSMAHAQRPSYPPSSHPFGMLPADHWLDRPQHEAVGSCSDAPDLRHHLSRSFTAIGG